MSSKNRLYSLISSLSSHEKQYISKRSNTFTPEKNARYLEIYNLISRFPEDSDAEIIHRLKGEITPNNFAVAKKYVLAFICDALTDYHKQDDSEIALLRDVETLIMLIRKGQFEICLKLWKSAIRKATDQEIYPVMLHLIEIYQQLMLYYQVDMKTSDLEEAIEHYHKLERKHHQFQQILSLYYEVTVLRKKVHFRLNSKQNEQLSSIIDRASQIPEALQNSFLYNHYYNLTLGTIYFLKGEYDLAYPFMKKNIDAWQNNSNRIRKDNTNYLESMMGFQSVALLNNQYEDSLQVMGNLNNEHIKGTYNRAFFDFIQFITLNRLFNRTAQYDRVEMLLPQMEASLEKHFDILVTEQKRIMLISMGIAYFALGRLSDAFNKLYTTRSYFYDSNRKDQISFTYLFLLLIAFEMNDETIFRNEYNNTYHFFYSKEKPHAFEKEIISGLNRAFGESTEIKNQIYNLLLQKLTTENNDMVQKQVFQMFNFPDWIRCKLEGITYRDYRMMRYNKSETTTPPVSMPA